MRQGTERGQTYLRERFSPASASRLPFAFFGDRLAFFAVLPADFVGVSSPVRSMGRFLRPGVIFDDLARAVGRDVGNPGPSSSSR